ncbi:MAG TPA: type II secretion system minor pseudopilin GspK [Luteimonas sp.]|nr:type II secretion system minor pseudopilin GspK [Luteimonas sp.]
MKARGAALLLVLWLVALLAALVGSFALAARTEHLQGQVLARGTEAHALARAGLEYAIWRVSQPDRRLRWMADGREYRWDPGELAPGADVRVRIVDEQGKVDLNMADATLLSALFQATGSPQPEAAAIAAAILDWRDVDDLEQPQGGAEDRDYAAAGRHYGAADAPFASVAELEQVLGMTPQVYARVAPHLTVFSGRPVPNPTFASAAVLSALGYDPESVRAMREAWSPDSGAAPPQLTPGQPLVADNSGTYSIESRARVRGRTAVLRVVVRSGGNGLQGSAWTPLRWEEGASPR